MSPSPAEKAVERIVQMELERDPCYILGRLIAITERIVYAASRTDAGVKAAGVAEDAITRAPIMPARYYVRLTKLATDRLRRIGQSGSRHHVYDRLVTQIASEVGTELPKRMDSRQSAMMVSGYYHQRAALFAASLEETRADMDAALEAAKQGAAQLVAAGFSQVEAAERVGIDRLTLRRALGK